MTAVGAPVTSSAKRSDPGFLRALLAGLWRNASGRAGLILVGLITVPVLLAPWIAPHQPLEQFRGFELVGPTARFPLGTDELGRDMLSRLLYGGRVSFIVSIVAVPAGIAFGTLLGVLAGWYQGWRDAVIMRTTDVLLAFPAVVIGIGVVAVRGPGVSNVALAVALINVPIFARIARSSVLTVKNREFIEAAHAVGASTGALMRKHILPNILPPLLVQAGVAMAFAVLVESGLSFLGLGAQPPQPSWGLMLSTARTYLRQSLMYALAPGLAISVLVVGLNFVTDAIRDVLDPRGSRQE